VILEAAREHVDQGLHLGERGVDVIDLDTIVAGRRIQDPEAHVVTARLGAKRDDERRGSDTPRLLGLHAEPLCLRFEFDRGPVQTLVSRQRFELRPDRREERLREVVERLRSLRHPFVVLGHALTQVVSGEHLRVLAVLVVEDESDQRFEGSLRGQVAVDRGAAEFADHHGLAAGLDRDGNRGLLDRQGTDTLQGVLVDAEGEPVHDAQGVHERGAMFRLEARDLATIPIQRIDAPGSNHYQPAWMARGFREQGSMEERRLQRLLRACEEVAGGVAVPLDAAAESAQERILLEKFPRFRGVVEEACLAPHPFQGRAQFFLRHFCPFLKGVAES